MDQMIIKTELNNEMHDYILSIDALAEALKESVLDSRDITELLQISAEREIIPTIMQWIAHYDTDQLRERLADAVDTQVELMNELVRDDKFTLGYAAMCKRDLFKVLHETVIHKINNLDQNQRGDHGHSTPNTTQHHSDSITPVMSL